MIKFFSLILLFIILFNLVAYREGNECGRACLVRRYKWCFDNPFQEKCKNLPKIPGKLSKKEYTTIYGNEAELSRVKYDEGKNAVLFDGKANGGGKRYDLDKNVVI